MLVTAKSRYKDYADYDIGAKGHCKPGKGFMQIALSWLERHPLTGTDLRMKLLSQNIGLHCISAATTEIVTTVEDDSPNTISLYCASPAPNYETDVSKKSSVTLHYSRNPESLKGALRKFQPRNLVMPRG